MTLAFCIRIVPWYKLNRKRPDGTVKCDTERGRFRAPRNHLVSMLEVDPIWNYKLLNDPQNPLKDHANLGETIPKVLTH